MSGSWRICLILIVYFSTATIFPIHGEEEQKEEKEAPVATEKKELTPEKKEPFDYKTWVSSLDSKIETLYQRVQSLRDSKKKKKPKEEIKNEAESIRKEIDDLRAEIEEKLIDLKKEDPEKKQIFEDDLKEPLEKLGTLRAGLGRS
jgi:hypothetical protein